MFAEGGEIMCDWLKTVNKKVHIALHRDKLATVLPNLKKKALADAILETARLT